MTGIFLVNKPDIVAEELRLRPRRAAPLRYVNFPDIGKLSGLAPFDGRLFVTRRRLSLRVGNGVTRASRCLLGSLFKDG